MRKKKYSSDLTSESWQVIEKMISVQRKSKWALRNIVEAILYVCKNGCVWRDLPSDFPVWQTVYWYYRKWVKTGFWKKISDSLTAKYRVKMGKYEQL